MVGGLLLLVAVAALPARGDPALPAPDPATEQRVLDLDVAFFRARLQRDPGGSLDAARLAVLLLERARARGDDRDLLEAERLARRSLRIRPRRNGAAWQVLATALAGQHRFAEARDAALRAVDADGSRPGLEAMLGELSLELGEYREADRRFAGLRLARFTLPVAPRYARWLEVRGRTSEARRLLNSAAREAGTRPEISAQQLGWFELRLTELALRASDLRAAERRIRRARRMLGEDGRVVLVQARLALARGRHRQAAELADSALALRFDGGTLAFLAEAWRAAGDTGAAGQYLDALERTAGLAEGAGALPATAVHRAAALVLLDEGRQVPALLAVARASIRDRQDIYGWDLLAWALWRSGRRAEAWRAMTRALATGSHDPALRRHADAIAEGE